MGILRFAGRGSLPVIRQTEAAECGLACLAMIASFHGHRIDLNTLRRRFPISLNGVTLRALMQVAGHMHLVGRPLRYEMEHLGRLPAIVHWDMTHFVVLKSVNKKGIVVHDPALGLRTYGFTEADKHLTGVALELTPTEAFLAKDDRARLPLSVFWSQLRGSGHALVQILVLSIALQLLALAAPFYMQLTLDEVIARGDVDLLLVLAIGFGLLMLIRAGATAARASILLIVQNVIHFQLGARLFRHLSRLPIAFFEKRHVGDVISRFSSLQPIRDLLAEGMVTAILDGCMALAALALMFLYSIQLALIVAASISIYAVVRLALYSLLWRRTEATLQAQAQEQSTFIENLQTIQSTKLFNREDDREADWLNRYAEVVGANVRLGRTKIAFSATKDLVFGIETIVLVYMAAQLALENVLTVGMIFAFMSYKQYFGERSAQLIERALEFRMLGLHLERLSDIALTPIERGHDIPLSYPRQIKGQIELRNVFFRYAETEPFVLEDVSLTIRPGEFVTVMGPSGGGKTTLIKLMLGLFDPTSGEVLIDGVPLSVVGPRAYREQVGAIMQEDQLLSGSIADNICFYDPTFDQSRMIACAQLAAVHDEIMSMPMTYNTLVGQMGSSLSSGQKQRVLLARALYRNPRMLFMDEGTAHLDLKNEQHVNESLRRLRMTRISVAHRPDMAAGADRFIYVSRRVRSEDAASSLVDGMVSPGTVPSNQIVVAD